MRNLIRLALLAVAALGSLSAATITYSVTNLNTNNGLGQPLYRYVYNLIGVPLSANQGLEIRFEVSRYGQLQNQVTPNNATFNPYLFQPNSQPGADGIYGLYVSSANLMAGTFSIDFGWLNNNSLGFEQRYFVYQYASNGIDITSTVTSGFTTLAGGGSSSSSTGGGNPIPEPSTWMLGATALAALAVARRRRT
ncbi:MAG: PEP-CTERM sorting domain-containing protein [Bryobacteraceae bacterium]|nr:PEP-CTERM sorting domain-containing protein [Bryobacteraceae bacterium]